MPKFLEKSRQFRAMNFKKLPTSPKKTLSTNKFSRRKGVHRRNPCNFFSHFYYNQGKHGIENVKLRWKKEREITGRDAGRAAFLRERRKAREITALEKKNVSKVRVGQNSKDPSSNAILIAEETHLCDDVVGPAVSTRELQTDFCDFGGRKLSLLLLESWSRICGAAQCPLV